MTGTLKGSLRHNIVNICLMPSTFLSFLNTLFWSNVYSAGIGLTASYALVHCLKNLFVYGLVYLVVTQAHTYVFS